ncbi:chromosome segregation protein SMC [Arenicella xantha]|uniref:Chromosome partition protein Smc n=1 Tax=Arenicella xantha TaxID=644221 RepID=A0A395JJM2_9GAMM|nr:chromosome segregation protein SMC [Arenicella xantha]RBP50983.1 condensin subunit Smc [Arenicella xantha]
MRLKHIKLSGFKSFVDTTKVSVPNNLIGIVGPNGCGKSNVIDAIRWVMGESSAKTLRGDSMEDVIFNGSAVRKPVNRAYVELVFDNSDGSAPGSYAKFAEIGIRRELARDGGSKYFINRDRCRRKDIQDIFLGTGLGPRSYSIIEQGMVGRIVESKPEDLRVLIEEAAGISKYKERRRETENRIRHTRDNLSRVEDIIGELESQLRRLKRQANEAERYKNLKSEQREVDSQLKTLRWSGLQQQVKAKDVELERLQTEFESQVAEQRDVESQIEMMRAQQTELTENLNVVHAEYYGVGGEIAALEQSIEHARSTRQRQQEEFERLVNSELEASQLLEQDQIRLEEVSESQLELAPMVEELAERYETVLSEFQTAEQVYQHWQVEWEQLNRDAADPEKEREVQSARIEEQQRQIHHFTQRSEQVASTLTDIDSKLNIEEITQLKESVVQVDEECNLLESQLQERDEQIVKLRTDLEDSRERHNLVRHKLQDDSAQLNSLKALQAAALGEDNKEVNKWLQMKGIKDNPRLASSLQVKGGWELAVDTVLSSQLNAISVQKLEQFVGDFSDFKDGRVWVVDKSSAPVEDKAHKLDPLADKVTSLDIQIDGWFHGVYAVDSVKEALESRHLLNAHESIVTREGCWIGTNWASFGVDQAEGGVLQREAQIEKLTDSVDLASHEIQKIQSATESLQAQIKDVEAAREQARSDFRNKSHQRSDLHNQLGRIEARSSELLKQRDNLLIEQQELSDRLAKAKDDVAGAQKLMEDARDLAANFGVRREELTAQRANLTSDLEQSRQRERAARDERQAKQIELERLQSSQNSLQESIARLSQQLEGQAARRTELATLIDTDEDPTELMREQLQALIEKRLEVEQSLSRARDALADFENQMKNADQARLGFDRHSKTVRDSLETVRMARQELVVRRNTISEELDKDEEAMTLLQQALPEGLKVSELEQRLAEIIQKIERIGAVNLVAIDEYEECSERKLYLDKQNADLIEAMATLESAIAKIDKETRSRFKETFDSLNEGFKEFFPKLFGGGSAYLELTGNDMLNTGVGVMARPPGKRNSTIHLLSGGEKALTAVSLLFAFFELNPAPFCVLDEVDAPMDDANVERYAGVLKQLGEKTQLLFITHNKITMEVADVLVGVTMAEPGVSRLVAVDVAEAAAMAAQ